MEKTLSVHKIINNKEFTFDPKVYSKFKYGCSMATVQMASEMVKKFIEHDRLYNVIDNDTQIVIVPAAYRTVPSAAHFLGESMRTILNWYYHRKEMRPVSITKVHRVTSYSGDYGKLSQEDREKVLEREVLSVNEDVVKGKHLLFVDDIRVTGTHERLVQNMVDTYSTKGYSYLYYAETTPDIDPTIEDFLNKAAIKDVYSLAAILQSKHNLSARMIKEILRLSNYDLVTLIGLFQTNDLAINIVNQCIAEGYDKTEEFKRNFNYLKQIVIDEFNKLKETTRH